MAVLPTPNIRTFQVFPDVPEPLGPLLELAENLWWVWHPDAVELFRRLDRELWEEVYHNPVKLLGSISQEKLAAAAKDDGYLAHLNRVYAAFKEHLNQKGWYQNTHGEKSKLLVGVFLGGVWPARIAADLFRRPGRAGGRSSEIRQRNWACRWSASGCSIATDISSSISPPTAGSRKRIPSWISTTCRSSR